MALELCGVTAGLGSVGQEDELPTMVTNQTVKAFDGAWLDLVERVPEVHDRSHMAPELTLLPRTEPQGGG